MSNPLSDLRRLVAPGVARRSGVVTALSGGFATVTWANGGTGQVLCGVSVAVGDRVLVVGDSVSVKLSATTDRAVKIK